MTLNRQKSEEIFYEIKRVGESVNILAGVVQNPDFVNENNAYENYRMFLEQFNRCLGELEEVKRSVAKLHGEIDKNHCY